jgi:16S rRNA C1402 (ribose-2'-O) methylase RsmI
MSKLYIIATPIGNLEDLSVRALRILKEVKIIFCEDTRVSTKLFKHFELGNKKLISCHKDNEKSKSAEVLRYLDAGEDLALISDAGTPLISDPGSEVLKAIYETNHHTVVPIPGPSALAATLSVCPLDTTRFVFEGFLPHGSKQKRRVLRELASEKRSIVIFESPRRIAGTIKDIENIIFNQNVEEVEDIDNSNLAVTKDLDKVIDSNHYPSKLSFAELRRVKRARKHENAGANEKADQIFIAKEITKIHENFFTGSCKQALTWLETQTKNGQIVGEFVLVF